MSEAPDRVAAILERAADRGDALARLLGADRVAGRTGLPRAAVERALGHPALRRRLARMVGARLGLDPEGLRAAAPLVPPDRDALARAALLHGLALALASHKGVFLKEDYARLSAEFGPEALAFGVKHRAALRRDPALPPVALSRDAVERAGRAELGFALAASRPALAAVVADVLGPDAPEPGTAGDDAPEAGASEGPEAGPGEAEPSGPGAPDAPPPRGEAFAALAEAALRAAPGTPVSEPSAEAPEPAEAAA